MSVVPAPTSGRIRPESWPSLPLLALGLVGGAMAALIVWSPVDLGAYDPHTPAPARALIAASGVGLVVAIGAAKGRATQGSTLELLAAAGAGLGGLAALVAVPDPIAAAALILLLAGLQATRPGGRPLSVRLRGPVMASLLLSVGWLFAHNHAAPTGAQRVGALALALAVAAAGGVVPYLQDLVPEESAMSSCMVWTALFGPALALALPVRIIPELHADQVIVFADTLVGLGLANLFWGTIGAWGTRDQTAAWRCAFLADWGLALVGLGLGVQHADGRAAAFLALLAIVLVRLPLYFWARPVLLESEEPRLGPANIVLAVALAGAAPFAGFPIRLLLLRSATTASWPLAAALLAGMLLWAAHSFRLARTLGHPTGRTAFGVTFILLVSLALGLAPSVLLAVGRI